MAGSKSAEVLKFVKLIKDLQNSSKENTVSGIIKLVLEKSGYKEMLNDGSVEGEARLENISELVSVAQKYEKLEQGMALSIFLEEVSLIADADTMDDGDNAVTLMTVHSAKGLEFPYVVVAGLEDGIFPHSRSLLDRQELEEERRLMYVAMTRAMDRLYLLHARERLLYGESRSNAPSQFLNDIDENLMTSNYPGPLGLSLGVDEIGDTPIPIEIEDGVDVPFGMGDRVLHNIFGKGLVVDITGGVATIAFEDPRIGVKKLALSIAPLKKI